MSGHRASEIFSILIGDRYVLVDAEDAIVFASCKWWLRRAYSGRAKPYVYGQPNGKTVYLHRVLLKAPKGMVVDHINGDTLDNRRANLRLTDQSSNCANRDVPKSSTGFRGVYPVRHSTIFAARLRSPKLKLYASGFVYAEDAARAYDKAAKEAFGDCARLNFPSHQGES